MHYVTLSKLIFVSENWECQFINLKQKNVCGKNCGPTRLFRESHDPGSLPQPVP